LMMPNTGSTVCLRSEYSARPARLPSRCAMPATGSSVGRRRRILGKALQHRQVMGIAPQRHQRRDPRGFAGGHIGRAEVAAVGQYGVDLPECCRQRPESLQRRGQLLLIVGRLGQVGAEHQQCGGIDRRLRVVALHECAPCWPAGCASPHRSG